MIYLMQNIPIWMPETFMSIVSLRTQKPQIPLPFHPRSAGVNNFRSAGLHVDLSGIDAVEVCTAGRGVCRIEQAGREVVLSAGQSLYKLPGEHRRKTVLSPDGASENDPGKRLFARCLHLIRTRYNDPSFNVDTLSEMMQMHRTTLLRLFRRKQNTTPREYLIRYRIGQALHLLETTLLPVAEIAESSGFNRCNYFCQVIRSFCGKTPEQYRREKKAGLPRSP